MSNTNGETTNALDMDIEVVVVPVSDVDRAKRFYSDLGWRLDLDYKAGDDFRTIQFTPPGSGCSVARRRRRRPQESPGECPRRQRYSAHQAPIV